MPTLSETLSQWRLANQPQGDKRKLMQSLTIDDVLYDIKDPALDAIVTTIESRLGAVETKTIRESALTKAQDAAKFATAVTQGTDGQISVTYSDAQTTDIQRVATGASAGSAAVLYTAEDEEVIAGTKQVGDVKTPATDAQIALSGTTTEAALIEIAKAIAAEQTARATGDANLLGASTDEANALTIYGIKAYAKDLVDSLAGENWSENAKKVQEIIEELENSDNANAWATAIDKLAGLDIKYTQAEADAYNAGLTGAISTETSLTAEQATVLNGLSGVSSTTYEAGQTPTSEDAKLYNASLEGAKSTSSVKTPQTVKQYVDAAVANASGNAADAIANLDATVGSQTVATGKHVAVEVVETDGVLTGLTVTEDDIASAADLDALEDTVEEHAEVTAAALVDLDSRLTTLGTTVNAIDLTVKANKAAITTATINNWSASYNSSTQGLEWTNTQTTVYVPVSGQSL